jgi:hypothetical protein
MKIKTSELTGAALDWAVAQIENEPVVFARGAIRYAPGQFSDEVPYSPSTDWSQGGPIIEREWETLCSQMDARDSTGTPLWMLVGKDLLPFFMRCFVASKLGDEVDVPDEIVKVTAP